MMKSGVISISSTATKIKLPKALARKSEFAAAGETRYASKTWLRSSRAQVWLRATTAAKRKATHTRPPAIWRDSSALGSNEKLKTTTTSREKNSMELIASFDRHSRRRSLANVAPVTPTELLGEDFTRGEFPDNVSLMATPADATRECDSESARLP